MAKRDVLAYYSQCQADYLEMLETIKELKRCLDNKLIDEERFKEAQEEINVVKSNYETLSYIVMLLKIPTKEDKRKKYNEDNRYIYNYLVNADKEVTKKNNKEAIEKLKKMAKEFKEENGN